MGDLLFHVTKTGNAITDVTPGMIDHVAIVISEGQITPYWQQFYKEHGMEVPEGWPGSNPGELSQRQEVRIKGRLR
jgi:hypothetical protein